MMNAEEIVVKAQEEFTTLSRLPVSSVCGITKTDEGWMVALEGLERKAIPEIMDLLGFYEVRLDNDGNLLGFERKKLRKRGDTGEE